MASVFISYRRDGSAGWAGRVSDALQERIAEETVFIDESIPIGVNFEQHIDNALRECVVLIAVINPNWANVEADDGTPRLRTADDWVRKEVGFALERDDVTVVPLLVDGATMPAARDLPPDLAKLASCNAAELRNWSRDSEALFDRVLDILEDPRRSLRERVGDRTGPRVWNVPAPPPAFVGREALLDRLAEALASRGGPVVRACILNGMPGAGKTRAAAEFALQHADDYDVVWWVRAGQLSTRLSDYAMLADALDLPERHEVDVGYKARAVTRWLDRNTGWLLVLDDAPDADAVRTLIPRRGGAVLVTSRDRAGWAGFATALDVVELTPEEVVTYLERHARHEDSGATEQLVAALGGLPLTVADAVAYLNETGVPMAEYAAECREHGGIVELSLDRVPDAGVQLLRLCAFLVPDAIPLGLFTNHRACLPSALAAEGARAAHACHRYSLLERQGNRLHMHWLIQQRVRELMSEDEQRDATATVTVLLDEDFPTHIDSLADPSTWMHCAELLPHVLELSRTAEASDVRLVTLLMHAGSYLERRGQLDEACEVLEDAHRLAEQVCGRNDVHTAWVLNALGFALSGRGRAQEALAAHERALEIYEGTEPPYERTHPDVIRTRNNVGRCLHATGAVDAAAASLHATLADATSALDPGDLEIASIENNLGCVLRDLGDLAGAREQHEAALVLKKAGGNARDVATTLYDLGRVLYDMNELDQALERFAHAVEILESTLPDDHPQLAEARVRLGLALGRLGRTADADAEIVRGRSVLTRVDDRPVSADPMVAEAIRVADPEP